LIVFYFFSEYKGTIIYAFFINNANHGLKI